MVSQRHAILKEMGITQWVLREPVVTLPSETVMTETAIPDKPPAQSTTAKIALDVSLKPAPQTRDKADSHTKADTGVRVEPASNLAELRAQVAACTACELAQSRTHTVFGEGPDQADWLLVGEAPGQQEDRQGKPFVGRAGQLLSQMIRALDHSREQMFIANTLKCRPPNNRDPMPEELQACEPFLLKQIELLQPKVMLALGRFSAQALLKSEEPLGRLRGKVYHYGPDKIPLIVTYHPAYLLRKPADKAKVWTDLLLAYQQLEE